MGLSFKRSEPGAWVSAGLHGALLLGAIVGFSSPRLPAADEGMPVEIITDQQFSELTKGERQAVKVLPDPKPRADRVAETRQERDPGEAKLDAPAPPKRPVQAKVADEESEPAAAPPPPARRVAEAKPETAVPPAAPPARPQAAKPDSRVAEAKAAEAKAAEAKAAEAERRAERQEAEALERARVEAAKKAETEQQKRIVEAKARADADARSKAAVQARARADAEAKAELDAKMKRLVEAEAKAEADAAARQAAADAKARAESDAKAKAVADAKAKADADAKARKLAEAAERFSPGDISKLLASKEPARSSGATGRDVQKTASLGTATGTSQKLNPSQRDQLIGLLSEQLHRCWQVPVAAQTADKPPVPTVRVRLNQDGTLAGEPVVTNTSGDGLFRTVAESATRATRRCAPLRIPVQFQPFYNDWRDLLVNFDPRAVG